MNIYVGNLAYTLTEEDLQQAFAAFGKVDSVNIIRDQFSNQSKGFGFVEMADKAAGEAAVAGLNGKEVNGRALNVNEARPRAEGGGGRGGFNKKRSPGGGGGRRRY
ncbi:MAG TPA: RNA-binding protein [Syntrophales bacterium]|jgi:RNA recognition motif-containing protein|nr:RNA-binding protein [Syntrophales bacterium]HON23764.1 RNA-binding protein [Syntrophales bacterium]HOU78270.1 RNA-binding protein [Syntrophales bacterium]HPC33197.1 RNA-binding protein [Syntrophales bacterium]HQG35353.1 RNA-binding protein [Syntrophales bacterium]